MQEIFKYVAPAQAGRHRRGSFPGTGVRPRFLSHLVTQGIKIPGSYFDPSQPL